MKKNIHECHLTIDERLVSSALDVHFTVHNCTGYMEPIYPPIKLGFLASTQGFKCKKCKRFEIGITAYTQ